MGNLLRRVDETILSGFSLRCISTQHLPSTSSPIREHIASLFGFQLSEHDAEVIRSRLDVDAVLKSATDPETMAVKSVGAIGLEKRSEEV